MRQPLGVRLEVGHERRRRTVAGQVRDVAAECGQRRAQLVRGIGEKAPFRLPRALEAVEHRVERGCETAHLVGAVRIWQSPARVARAPDLAGGAIETRERLQRPAHEECSGRCTDAGGEQRGDHRQPVQGRDRVGEIGRRRRDDDRPSAGDVRERRRVHAKLAAETHGAVARSVAADRILRQRTREHAAAERKGAGDDPLPAIHNLDECLRPARRRVERTRSRDQRGSGDRKLRHTDRAGAKRAVELVPLVTRDEDVDSRAEHDDCEHRRRSGGENRAEPQVHRPMMNPTPRTVSISGGSPSLRRRLDT